MTKKFRIANRDITLDYSSTTGGAEPKEKLIAKLEKRCAKYEMTLSKMEKGICDICKETEKDNRLAELEKENVELKEKLEIEQNDRDDWFGKAVNKDRQLTEAKELLQAIVHQYRREGVEGYLVEEIEDFLKEG